MKSIASKWFLSILFVLLFCTVRNTSEASVIYVSGTITFNTAWTVDTVKVNGDLTVNSGVTLSIDPGTIVIFQGHYKLNVYGKLTALGLANDVTRFTINDTTGFTNISLNTGGWYGIRFYNGMATDTSKLSYCSFQYGKANGTNDDANGGAIFVKYYSNLIISNCTFDRNTAKTNGGAIYLRKSSPLVQRNTFKNNKAASGAGMYISSGGAKVYNNQVFSNFASSGGGGMFCADTSLALLNNNLIHHNAGLLGGGVGCYNSNPSLNNNTILYNNATHGGALSCITSNPVLTNNIMYYNTGSGTGNQVSLLNTGCNPNFYYCDISGGQAGFGGSGAATYAGIYQNNISLAPAFTDSVNNNYLIKQQSPCMDAGTTDTTGLKLLSFDVVGNPRISMNRVDIGAYERQQTVSVCGIISQNTTWFADTVKISCDVIINNGVTLTINPKVYVQSQGVYGITVNGRILANGTQADSITFTAKNTVNGWKGLVFNNTAPSNDTSKFSYCRVAYAKNAADSGGAMFVKNFAKIKISNSLFKYNTALYGGAIFTSNSGILIRNSSFIGNTANLTSGKGGAIYCKKNSGLLISKSFFVGNSSFNGGSIYSESSSPVIKLSMFTNNTATSGGAMMCDTSNAKIINCIMVNNTASDAGALYLLKSNAAITNSTISNNQGNSKGGGMLLFRSSPILTNSILYANTATTSGNQAYVNDTLSAPQFFSCDVLGDTSSIGKNGFTHFHGIYLHNMDTIPAYLSPSAGSGSTYAGLSANWSLSDCSHLYNKGEIDTTGLKLPTKDFAGNARIYLNRIDIGAYEIIKPYFLTQPQPVVGCVGDTAIFSVSVEASFPVVYLWQYSSNGGFSWNTAPGVSNDSVYLIPSVASSQNGYLFRCQISSNCTQTSNSQSATLQVGNAPQITSQPSNLIVCQSSSSSFTVGAGGTNIAYQWQQQPPASTVWSNCTGLTATQSTYTITNTPYSLNGYKYRCLISGSCPPDTSSAIVVLTVKAQPSFTNQPSNFTTCQGNTATFTVVAAGANITYQWEESTNGGTTWNTAAGVSTLATYTITGVNYSMTGYKYRCVITGDCQPSVTSNIVTLTVNSNPLITAQPLNTNVCVNRDTTISVVAVGGNLSYQWKKKAPGDLVWSNATGTSALSANYQINNASLTMNNTWFRCYIHGLCAPDTISDSVKLSVHSIPSVSLGADTSIWLYTESVTLDAGGGYAGYHWSTGDNTQTITVVGTVAGVGTHIYSVTVTDNYGCSGNDNIMVTVKDNTGISVSETNGSIHVYPNPTSGYLSIDLEKITEPLPVIITTLDGKELFSQVFDMGKRTEIIDLSGYSKGVYVLSFEMNNKTVRKKIVLY
jgi:parallel beta-helix repeat protein/predicted outer membrane repeat protein